MPISVTERVEVVPASHGGFGSPDELKATFSPTALIELNAIVTAAIGGTLTPERAQYGIDLLREFSTCWANAAETYGIPSTEVPAPLPNLKGRELAEALLKLAASGAQQGTLKPRAAEDAAIVHPRVGGSHGDVAAAAVVALALSAKLRNAMIEALRRADASGWLEHLSGTHAHLGFKG